MSTASTPSPSKASRGRTAFLFPGQGSLRLPVLRRLCGESSTPAGYLEAADAAARRLLGHPFLPVLDEREEESEAALAACPDLDQLAIYLTNVLLAERVLANDVRPDLLVGHSFGELSALAVAGVFSVEAGLEIVGHRARALAATPSAGGMAALSCDADRARSLLREAHCADVSIAVLNSPRQTVVSGPDAQLAALTPPANSMGVSVTRLQSRYPFHSPLLAPAAASFREALRQRPTGPPRIPVLAAGERRLWLDSDSLAAMLSSQLVAPLDFQGILGDLSADGFRTFIECGGGDVLTRLVGRNLKAADKLFLHTTGTASSSLPEGDSAAGPAPVSDGEPALEPIAIVSMGCVLPGASNPDEFWQRIQSGASGVVDLAALDADARSDFVAGSPDRILPDKTYTLLNGAVRQPRYDPLLLAHAYDEATFDGLTRGQRMLALALGQARAGLAAWDGACACILGSTADGCAEYDEALVTDHVLARLERSGEPQAGRDALAQALGRSSGRDIDQARNLAQHRLYPPVVERVLAPMPAYAVDGACASSLYAIDLGMKRLREGRADVVVAGGVFGAGPANNVLFAQFRGLTANASRPFDARADGVVFGDGAALVVLKRLRDAIASGDTIHAVVRSSGLSSDGRSPAANVPQTEGQALAMARAAQRSRAEFETIQYIEAHATSTPTGDAVELKSLQRAFAERDPSRPPIRLGSVKALIGHTGWVSGVASVIKICLAFAARQIPAQHQYDSPAPATDPAVAGLEVPRQARPWPTNADGLPRRAGVNGFGFGGVNAHLVLEEFAPDYHQRLSARHSEPAPKAGLAVVAAADLLPADGVVDRSTLALPPGKRLLPDVTDHMDTTQYLASHAAGSLLAGLPPDWLDSHRDAIGVVLGLSGKTELGTVATERIFIDRLRRLCRLQEGAPTHAAVTDALERAIAQIQSQVLPSGPYTLSGLMPNVAAGRVANLFDLKGPNLVIDDGEESLLQALEVAGIFLAHGDCTMVLAGALEARGSTGIGREEGVGLLALTTLDTARREGLPILAELTVSEGAEVATREPSSLIDTVRRLMRAVAEASGTTTPSEIAGGRVSVAVEAASPATVQPTALPFDEPSPIYAFTPEPVGSPASSPPAELGAHRVLFLVDRESTGSAVREFSDGAGLSYSLACPAHLDLPGAVPIDLESEDAATTSVESLDELDFDVVVAVADVGDSTDTALLLNPQASECRLLDLLFVVGRHCYAAIREQEVALSVLCLRGLAHAKEHPTSALLGGFVKALARELPASTLRMVTTEAGDIATALEELAVELGQSDDAATAHYRGGERYVPRLTPVRSLASTRAPILDADSVVLVSGGGRGVSAVLAEELLSRFGCTVVALGRTDLEAAPDWLTAMDEAAFADFERDYYRQQLAEEDGASMAELKRRYSRLQATNELSHNVARLRRAGDFTYRTVDLTDGAAVLEAVEQICRDCGRIDMVVHGAGLQDSRILPKKSLESFRRIVATKLGGLAHLYRACLAHRGDRPVHFHLLTSAFSYMGNDGQPDYGAANEAMNRIAATMNAGEPHAHWSTLAWLGWAGIGMTRGSEFAALAADRGLRGVTADEGRAIFGSLLDGPPSHAVNVLMADGELSGYRVALTAPAQPLITGAAPPAAAPTLDSCKTDIDLSTATAPFLLDHRVGGVPTVPGAILIGLAAEASAGLRPGLKIAAFEDTHFARFVRVPEGRDRAARIEARVVEESDDGAVVQVRLLSDVVHRTGLVLEKDAILSELRVRLAGQLPVPPPRSLELNGMPHGRHLPDPYVLAGSPVQLDGPFRCLRQLVVDTDHRKARYRAGRSGYPPSRWGHLLATGLMVDAFWRFGTVQQSRDRSLPVFVPERCAIMRVYFDYLARDADRRSAVFTGINPTLDGDQLRVGPIEATDPQGRLLLRVEGGICRQFGEVEHGY